MSRLSKVLIGVWVILALASFVCAFFLAPIPKIIGLAFGTLNMLTILTYVIAFIQAKYQMIKIEDNGMQLQETSKTKSKKGEVRG